MEVDGVVVSCLMLFTLGFFLMGVVAALGLVGNIDTTICNHYGMQPDSSKPFQIGDYVYCVGALKTYNEDGSYTVKEIHKAFLKKPKEAITQIQEPVKQVGNHCYSPFYAPLNFQTQNFTYHPKEPTVPEPDLECHCMYIACKNWTPPKDSLVGCVEEVCEGC